MNEVDFRAWLFENNVKKKVASDIVSRLKRVEKEINHCDIDEEYRSDKCAELLSFFYNKGQNSCMNSISTNLPVGKYQLSTYSYAIRKYINFIENGDVKSQ